MDTVELREHLAEVTPDEPYYELLILDFGTNQPAWFACNHCGRDVTDGQGCPDHAPLQVPGLARADCVPCPSCVYESSRAAREYAERCRHWGWRRWKATRRLVGVAYALGVIAGSGTTWGGEYDHKWCVTGVRWRGSRPYILGAARETWRCWSRGHRRGEEVGFGFCGKCVPWPCCGSQRQAHADGCPEDDNAAVARG